VAVNLTARDLDDQDLPCRIVELLRCHGVPAPHLRVEITETTLMKNPEHARRVLKDLRDVGVCVAIDDFGTGYSSLAYLKRLPADELKIDKSFVRHVATDEGDAAIVRSVIALGHELGFSVTAEGVEDRASLDWLRRVGCDRAQGYFFAHPLDAAGLAAWVGSWAPNGAAPIPSGAGITSLPRVRRSRVSEAVTTSEAA
jgi:EAL domain-containing protein (putative c-di-GMP-specific phosphodiesterase class I)